jgi:hypothetical protein
MRRFSLAVFAFAVGAVALAAADSPDDRHPFRWTADPEYRDRLKQYLSAYRRLSPEAQERVNKLDQDLQEEDAATRARLHGVMERYALWLSRLPDADRARVQSAAAGQERLRVVRDVVEKQWMDGLPPARKAQLARSSEAERAKLIEQWHDEDRARQRERMFALRDTMFPVQTERFRQLRDDVQKFVKSDLEPRLSPRERDALGRVMKKGTGTWGYFHQVWVLSEAKGVKPPGPPEFWAQFRDARKAVRPPE